MKPVNPVRASQGKVIGRRVRRLMPLSAIEIDRLPFGRVLELVRFLEGGGKVPPIHVMLTPNGRWRVKDGRHRYAAFKLLGFKLIEVEHALHPKDRDSERWQIKPEADTNIPFVRPPASAGHVSSAPKADWRILSNRQPAERLSVADATGAWGR